MSARISADRYFPAFDSLRTIGFVGIVAQHTNHSFHDAGTNLLSRLVSAWFSIGVVWLELFFVLSGYLITGILLQARDKNGYFRNFYARRTLRIMPLYFAFLFFTIVLTRLDFAFCGWIDGETALSFAMYYSNFRMAFTGEHCPFLYHLWSLAVEEQYYLLWPLAVWSLRRQSLMRLCVILAVAALVLRLSLMLAGAKTSLVFYLTPCRLDGLLAGSFVALAQRSQADWARLRQWSKTIVLSSACLLLAMALAHLVNSLKDVVYTVGIFVMAMFNAGVVVMLVNMEKGKGHFLGRLLENKTLCTIGKYTYAMYLFHVLILLATVPMVPSSVSPIIAKLVTLVVVTLASFVAAWLSYHLFEKHFLRLKRFFEYRQPACPSASSQDGVRQHVEWTTS